MTFDEVKKEVIKFSTDRNWDQYHTPENLAKSIAIEAGELLECFQWSPNYDEQAVKEELADVMNYCIQMADKLNISIEGAIMEKISKNAEKYPVEKSYGSSKKYTEL
ncbi:MAG: nucleotide pyrophosphohydrolase [Butyrivibrio sp.]|uniref:nucleotide pyrophosphohydrolase n=1 Tax=Butyrivibrio sp. TaxID=28121 RepID=UPI001B10482A|nr:nucleotide pyrophosphohydrolase [Butyrivibrio sp.]MBO6242232.1 nucleotide pyrophosphohydrolase [Butyrivibrio sp.]